MTRMSISQDAVSAALVRTVEAFLVHEARLLDERRFEEWAELFTPDGYYWAPAQPSQSDPTADVSIFFDDRELMQERIRRLRHPRVHAQLPASRTSHLVANVTLERRDGERRDEPSLLVRSKFLMCEFRPSLPEGIKRFFSGTAWHEIAHLRRGDEDEFRIRWKRVELVDCDAAFEPLAIYF
jgi:3-phenylpropionate/cinnamic acid dioxygenase small subunit